VSCVSKLLPDDTVAVATNRLVLSLVRVFVELTGIAYSLQHIKEGAVLRIGSI